MYLKTLEINVLKYMIYELNPAHFLSALGLAWQTCLKNTRVKLELSTVIDMLLVIEKGNRGRICQKQIST